MASWHIIQCSAKASRPGPGGETELGFSIQIDADLPSLLAARETAKQLDREFNAIRRLDPGAVLTHATYEGVYTDAGI